MRTVSLLILVAVLSAESPSITLQTLNPHTVLDYYLLLPEKYFEANEKERVKWMLDPLRGAIVDVKNGYLYAPGDGAQTDIYVCLFKKADGNYLIAVKTHPGDTDEYTYLDFYVFEGGRLLDVTKTVLPLAVNEEFKYELPRYGTTIHVKNKSGGKIYDLLWASDRFRLKKS
jgi:hypothetical protein